MNTEPAHLPSLRLGPAYESLDQVELADYRNGKKVASVSKVNAGLIRRDLNKIAAARDALKRFRCSELIGLCERTGEQFLNATLPLGNKGHTQSPQQYVEQLSATSGLPHVMVRKNMEKIHSVLTRMETILRGLTRGLDWKAIDDGIGEQNGVRVSYYAGNPNIQVHGPGFSKVLIGADEIERWPEFLDVLISSIAESGGRSCINASCVVVPSRAAEIADALAKKLGAIEPLPADDPNARLAGFANSQMAEYIDQSIEDGLKIAGAEDVTSRYRNGPRLVRYHGATYLRPTIIRCDSFEHPLANREFLFPYASVVEVPQEKMLEQIGPSLVVTAVSGDEKFIRRLLASPLIDRLNIGPIPTTKISLDQPHEGNLFEFLYKRRAIDQAIQVASRLIER